MKVSGFTFIRNGTLLGYPYVESIKSILPIVDEFVVNVGNSEDDTLERIRDIGDPKIKIIESTWNEKMQDRGYVYGQQKMIAHFNCTGDWAFYLEGDEIVHENDLLKIRKCMEENLDNKAVEAIAFNYHHFLGGATTVADNPHFYRREARIIRNTIRSYHPDGLFFVVLEKNKRGRYPRAIIADAYIYHYGHIRSVEKMKEKASRIAKYWGEEFATFQPEKIDPLLAKPFAGNHPDIVKGWIDAEAIKDYKINTKYKPDRKDRRYRLEKKIENLLGIDLSKKHFQKIL
jgi:hypothetical protein